VPYIRLCLFPPHKSPYSFTGLAPEKCLGTIMQAPVPLLLFERLPLDQVTGAHVGVLLCSVLSFLDAAVE